VRARGGDVSSRRAEYRRRFALVREIVNRFDPIGLIASGCPADEHEQEIALVLVAMKNASNKADLCARIKGLFAERFCPADVERIPRWSELGAELWAIRDR